MDPSKANPQDRERCNLDARGNADVGSANLHNQVEAYISVIPKF